MRFLSTLMTCEELKKLADDIADKFLLEVTNTENRTSLRGPSRGKFKGRIKSDFHFIIRPQKRSDFFRKCSQNRKKRQSYTCWMGYIQFAKELMQWWSMKIDQHKPEEFHFEYFSGGRKYSSVRDLERYIEDSERQYWTGCSDVKFGLSQVGDAAQMNYCMCVHGRIEDQNGKPTPNCQEMTKGEMVSFNKSKEGL